MLSIPLPFVAAFLLFLVIVVLRLKAPNHWKKPIGFIFLCIITMTVVGLRWTMDYPFLRAIQPILGACLPVTAWLSFSKAHRHSSSYFLHSLGPLIVALCSLSYPYLWPNIIDYLVPLLSLFYGLSLIKSSFSPAEEVSLNQLTQVSIAERATGLLLIISALTDSAISYDFFASSGVHTHLILSVSYLILIPAIASMVVFVSICTPIQSGEVATEQQESQQNRKEQSEVALQEIPSLNEDETSRILSQFETLMTEHEVFKDANLTLSKIARKLVIPARKISASVNHKYGENISKVINTYRINHAKDLLVSSDMPITDIYLSSGFQTKSNFNREFSRITGQTPSDYRQTNSVNTKVPEINPD